MNQQSVFKYLLATGLLGASVFSSLSAVAAEPIIKKSGKYCPPMYLKISGVCVNPESICHSRSQLHEAIQNFLQQGHLDKRYHCAKKSISIDNMVTYNTPTIDDESEITENLSLSCSELNSTIIQYQNAGVPLMDTSSQKISQMSAEAAEQVINRLVAEQSQRCR